MEKGKKICIAKKYVHKNHNLIIKLPSSCQTNQQFLLNFMHPFTMVTVD